MTKKRARTSPYNLPENNNPFVKVKETEWGLVYHAVPYDEYIDFECQKSKSPEAAFELEELMTEISIVLMQASWHSDTEFVLWAAALGKETRLDSWGLTQEQKNRLKSLSELSGGWWVYDANERFISLEEWQNIWSGNYLKRDL